MNLRFFIVPLHLYVYLFFYVPIHHVTLAVHIVKGQHRHAVCRAEAQTVLRNPLHAVFGMPGIPLQAGGQPFGDMVIVGVIVVILRRVRIGGRRQHSFRTQSSGKHHRTVEQGGAVRIIRRGLQRQVHRIGRFDAVTILPLPFYRNIRAGLLAYFHPLAINTDLHIFAP